MRIKVSLKAFPRIGLPLRSEIVVAVYSLSLNYRVLLQGLRRLDAPNLDQFLASS